MPLFIAKPWAFFCIVLPRLVTALRRDNFTMTYFLVITGTVSRECAQLLRFFGPGTFSDGRLAEQMRGLAWFTRQSDPEFRLPLAFYPSTLLPLLLRLLFFRSLHLETMSLMDSRHKFSDFRWLGNFFAWVILQE